MFMVKHFSRGDGLTHEPLYDLKTETELTELLKSFANDAELMELIRKVNHVPLHELERQVLNMPVVPAPPYETGLMMDGKGNIVENPDYRQPTDAFSVDPSLKWYGAQFHASDYWLIADWLNEIGAVDCKILQFNNIVSGAMFFALAAVQEEK